MAYTRLFSFPSPCLRSAPGTVLCFKLALSDFGFSTANTSLCNYHELSKIQRGLQTYFYYKRVFASGNVKFTVDTAIKAGQGVR